MWVCLCFGRCIRIRILTKQLLLFYCILLFTWLTRHSPFFTCLRFLCAKRNLPKRFIVCRVCLFGPWSFRWCLLLYFNMVYRVTYTKTAASLTALSLSRARWYVLKVINQICSQRRQWVTQLVWNEKNVLRSHSKRQLSIRSARIVNKKTKQTNRQNKTKQNKRKEKKSRKNWNKDDIYITSMWKIEKINRVRSNGFSFVCMYSLTGWAPPIHFAHLFLLIFIVQTLLMVYIFGNSPMPQSANV